MALNDATAERNYAKALFDLASNEGLIEKILTELQAVCNAISDSNFSKNFLHLPSVPQEEKLGFIAKLLDSVPLESITKNFILLLARNSRLTQLQRILESIAELKDAKEGICKVHISAALPLTKRSKSLLKEMLESSLNKKVLIDEKTDQGLLGGMRIEFLGRVLDMSTKAKLKKILECSDLN